MSMMKLSQKKLKKNQKRSSEYRAVSFLNQGNADDAKSGHYIKSERYNFDYFELIVSTKGISGLIVNGYGDY